MRITPHPYFSFGMVNRPCLGQNVGEYYDRTHKYHCIYINVNSMTNRPFPLKFELPSPARQLRVERIHEHTKIGTCSWRLWLTANGDFTLGTYIQLMDNGTINRVTWHEDGTETILEVRDGQD